jgi:hypothetical protein
MGKLTNLVLAGALTFGLYGCGNLEPWQIRDGAKKYTEPAKEIMERHPEACEPLIYDVLEHGIKVGATNPEKVYNQFDQDTRYFLAKETVAGMSMRERNEFFGDIRQTDNDYLTSQEKKRKEVIEPSQQGDELIDIFD